MLSLELLGNQGQQALTREEALRKSSFGGWVGHMSSKTICDIPLYLIDRDPYNGSL